MSYFFFFSVIFSVLFGILSGNLDAVSAAALEESSHSVTLSLELLGMLCFWGGIMEAASRSGLTEKIRIALMPILGIIFPRIRKNAKVMDAISMNITANMLGLGNAATPLGISAMKELKKLFPDCTAATAEMVCFVVMNTASFQLLPTTVAALRMESGAQNPLDILPAVWVVSLCSLAAGIFAAKLGFKREGRK